MDVQDCDVCLSAGSINKWGICEICGEEFEETVTIAGWGGVSIGMMHEDREPVALEHIAQAP